MLGDFIEKEGTYKPFKRVILFHFDMRHIIVDILKHIILILKINVDVVYCIVNKCRFL